MFPLEGEERILKKFISLAQIIKELIKILILKKNNLIIKTPKKVIVLYIKKNIFLSHKFPNRNNSYLFLI